MWTKCRRRVVAALWLLILVLTVSAPGVAAAPICAEPHVPLADSSAVLRLPLSSQMTATRLMQFPDSAFAPVSPHLFRGSTRAQWWLRIDLFNSGVDSCNRWLQVGPNHLHDVRVYVWKAGAWQKMVAGADHPFEQWPLNERRPVFPVTVQPGVTHVVVQVVTSGEITSFAPQLWNPIVFQGNGIQAALSNGLIYGLLILLIAVSLFLGIVFRRWPLCLMALAVGFYMAHDALQKNYLLVYLWPDQVVFNLWALYFLVGCHFVALFGYFYDMVRVHRMGWWQWVFYPSLAGFALIALFGGLPGNTQLASVLVVSLYQAMLWLLAIVYVLRWLLGVDRRWFPLFFLGAFCLRSVTTFAPLVGMDIRLWSGNFANAPMIVILGVFLFGTLLSQMRKERRQQIQADIALERQRATENERLERTVAQRTGELNNALQARRQLLGRISHDLRAPLAGMIDSVRQWRSGNAKHDYSVLIERNVRQQMDMIDELLEFSRTEASELEPEPIPGYLHAFLNEVAEQAELTAEQHGNRLEHDFADDLPALISVDFHYLRRVLINLLGNASKFTDHGVVRFAVESRQANDANKGRLHFAIDDNGPGIEPEERKRLLQPFARGANAKRRQGHGLGLAIVTQLLARLGGQLQIADAPTGGSRFHFELEVEFAGEGDLEPIFEEGETVDVDGADQVILVVDDEPQQREVTTDLLAGYGFDSVAAADGAAALLLLQTRCVDLVVTDQYMAGVDGWDLLLTLRERYPAMPVLLYSSVPPRPPSDGAYAHEFDGEILKPASGARLLRKVVQLLGTK